MEKVFAKFYKNNKTKLDSKPNIFNIADRDKHLRNEDGSIKMNLQLLQQDTTIVSSLWGN
jgi:hypothetical protein